MRRRNGVAVRAILIKINRAGVPTKKFVRTANRGDQFDSISCTGIDACELASWSYLRGGIVVASWNGTRLGTSHIVSPPIGSGSGNFLPGISCSRDWCEVFDNFELFNGQQDNAQHAFLVTTHHGKPAGSHSVPGYLFSDVSCSSGACYSILENDLAPGATPVSFLARVTHGVVGSPKPVNLAASALACRGQRCIVVGRTSSQASPRAHRPRSGRFPTSGTSWA